VFYGQELGATDWRKARWPGQGWQGHRGARFIDSRKEAPQRLPCQPLDCHCAAIPAPTSAMFTQCWNTHNQVNSTAFNLPSNATSLRRLGVRTLRVTATCCAILPRNCPSAMDRKHDHWTKDRRSTSTRSCLSGHSIQGIRTPRNLTLPLVIFSRASLAFSRGNFSIMQLTPCTLANEIASSLSRACPDGQA